MRNLHKEITDRIVARLKAGVVPWRQPWSGKGFGVMPRNALTQRAYSGANVILLWSRAQESGFQAPLWLTFKQALELGGNVRKGEKGETVIYVSKVIRQEDDGTKRAIPFLKAYTVFNVAQCDNLPAKIVDPASEARAVNPGQRDELADAFHELGHWTGAEKRLGRTFGKRFGDRSYAVEELVAELTSAFLCGEFGFDNDGVDADYIATWIKLLEEHEKVIVAAAAAASRAVEFMREAAIAAPGEELEELEPMLEAA